MRATFEGAGINVRETAMQFSDYRMDIVRDDGSEWTVLVERKTPSDFIHSTSATIKDPATKMARQLNGCLEELGGNGTLVLLIDGLFYPMKGGKMRAGKVVLHHYMAAFAAKLRTIHNHGIRVEYSPADWYLPEYLLGLYAYEKRAEHNTLSLAPRAIKVPSKEDAKWVVLMGIPGVGPSMAQKLLAHFGTVSGVANASVDALKKVKGVGAVTAERIQWHLN